MPSSLTAKVSKQFMSDLEGGRPTVQMGRVLAMLQAMGVRMSLEVPDAAASAGQLTTAAATADGSQPLSTCGACYSSLHERRMQLEALGIPHPAQGSAASSIVSSG